MQKEAETKRAPEVDSNSSRVIICSPAQAEAFVRRLSQTRKRAKDEVLTIILDGQKIQPQENFSRKVLEIKSILKEDQFSRDYKNYHIDKAVNAGLFVAILEKIIEESKRLATKQGKDIDTSWEEKIARMVSRFPWTETDKVSGACSALKYAQKAVEKLGLEGANLLLLNFDKINHPGLGPRRNTKMEEDLIEFNCGVDVILFRQNKGIVFKESI